MREFHNSKVAGHFGVGKTMVNLQGYIYCPRMQEDVAWFIRGCITCCTNKPNNRKQGLYHHVPIRPWKNISLDCVGGIPTIRNGHEYLFIVVDRFNKVCILMPCKKSIK